MFRILLLILLSYSLLQGQDSRTVLEDYNKAVSSRKSISFSAVEKMKYYNTDEIRTDSQLVFIMRKSDAPYLQALVRIQHSNGNTEAYNGFEYRMLDSKNKNIIIYDTTNAAGALLIGRGIAQLVTKMLPTETNGLTFASFYKYSDPE